MRNFPCHGGATLFVREMKMPPIRVAYLFVLRDKVRKEGYND